jgi:hypothetical protein
MERTRILLMFAVLPAACSCPDRLSPLSPYSGDAAAVAADARQEPAPQVQKTAVTVPVGIGFTDSPDTLLLAGAVDFPAGENWTLGPAVQLGVDDDLTLFAPTIQAKWFFPLKDSELKRLLPFATGGVGIAYLDDDRGGGRDDTGLLLAVGGGLRYRLADHLSLGTQMQLNFMPGEVLDERFYFSWEVVQVVFGF